MHLSNKSTLQKPEDQSKETKRAEWEFAENNSDTYRKISTKWNDLLKKNSGLSTLESIQNILNGDFSNSEQNAATQKSHLCKYCPVTPCVKRTLQNSTTRESSKFSSGKYRKARDYCNNTVLATKTVLIMAPPMMKFQKKTLMKRLMMPIDFLPEELESSYSDLSSAAVNNDTSSSDDEWVDTAEDILDFNFDELSAGLQLTFDSPPTPMDIFNCL
ncbi:hypothetical protein ILUMI_23637 [Ignelater luminosus]|uniref:Uncharacterized protein n=1 Tax=Ignelater luminosus TaxID=2038154 RepID=A0A8K0G1P8_IGNLU|nr:hypothetical protein ILUMI_23637 [Ignelater luminosus]